MPKKITHEEFIEKLKPIKPHIEILSKYNGNKKYITAKCTIHNHIWETKPNWLMHEGKFDCQKCYDDRRGNTTRNGIDFFIGKGNILFNNKYDYSKVEYVNNKQKVCIICPQHGGFMTTPEKHLNRKQGCPKCANKNVTTDEFIEKAKKIHGDRYDYSKVNYVNNSTNITLICSIHGDFEATPDKHLQGCNCSKCAGKFMDLEYFKEKSNKKHNFLYDYSKSIYIDKKTSVIIICPKHGEFSQSPDNHMQGNGCPICKTSKIELITNDFLKKNNIEYNYEKKFDWTGLMSLDFYLPEYNMAVECQGGQHFKSVEFFGGEDGFEKTLKRDILKNKLCAENGVDLIYVIDDSEFSEDILENNLFEGIYSKENIIVGEKESLSKLIKQKINKKLL